MALAESNQANLKTIVRAAKLDKLAVLECQRKDTGKVVPVLCAVGWDGKEYQFTPFAEMFEENPYEMLNPPDPEGGFFSDRLNRK